MGLNYHKMLISELKQVKNKYNQSLSESGKSYHRREAKQLFIEIMLNHLPKLTLWQLNACIKLVDYFLSTYMDKNCDQAAYFRKFKEEALSLRAQMSTVTGPYEQVVYQAIQDNPNFSERYFALFEEVPAGHLVIKGDIVRKEEHVAASIYQLKRKALGSAITAEILCRAKLSVREVFVGKRLKTIKANINDIEFEEKTVGEVTKTDASIEVVEEVE